MKEIFFPFDSFMAPCNKNKCREKKYPHSKEKAISGG